MRIWILLVKGFASIYLPLNHRDVRARVRALLLTESELATDQWQQGGTWSWRTGTFGAKSDVMREAGRHQSFSAKRHFHHRTVAHGGLSVGVSPLLTLGDALEAIPQNIGELVKGASWRDANFVEIQAAQRDVEGIDSPRCLEARFIRPDRSGTTRFVVGCVDNFMLTVLVTGDDDGVSWDEACRVSFLQAAKLREALSKGELKGWSNRLGE